MFTDDLRPRVRGRSFYAALVPFSATCFTLTLLTDLAYWVTDSILWETMSVWLLAVGLLVATFAILAGIVDLVRSRKIRGLDQRGLAILGHAVAFGLSIVNVFVHSRDGYTAVVPQGLILSFVVVLVLLVTAFMGRPMAVRTRVGGLA